MGVAVAVATCPCLVITNMDNAISPLAASTPESRPSHLFSLCHELSRLCLYTSMNVQNSTASNQFELLTLQQPFFEYSSRFFSPFIQRFQILCAIAK